MNKNVLPIVFLVIILMGLVYAPKYIHSLSLSFQAAGGDFCSLSKSYSRGVGYCNSREYQKAVDEFTRILEKKPDSADALYYRSIAYKNLGQTDKYVKDYARAAQLDKKYAHPYALGLGGWQVPIPGAGYEKQLDYYTQLIKKNPADVESWNSRGKFWMSLGEYDKAIEDFTQTVNIDPNFARGYNNRGSCLKNKKLYYQAIEDFNKAIALSPGFVMPYSNMGNTYAGLGRFDEAIHWFKKAMQVNPNFPDTYVNCGVVYRDMGMYKEAIQCWEKCIALNPSSAGMLRPEIRKAKMKEKIGVGV